MIISRHFKWEKSVDIEYLICSPSISTNLPPTAYIKMIDFWLIFNLLKPFIDIIVQTYIETLRDSTEDNKKEEHEEEKDNVQELWVDKKISPPMKDLK